jgi:hypothetical protein
VIAVWQERNLSFPYRSATAVYSCSALAGRVASVLRELGARDDVKVRVNDCSESITPPPPPMIGSRSQVGWGATSGRLGDPRVTGQGQLVQVNVRAMMPVEVTPEVAAELKRDKERRELISRVTANPAARFNDPILFNAQREVVTLSHKTIGLSAEECELIEQMSASVFRRLDMRVVRRAASCSPDSRLPPEVVVEALRATAFETGQGPLAPSRGDEHEEEDRAEPAAPAPPVAPEVPPVEPPAGETSN